MSETTTQRTVTFFFSDIEGSTRLAERLGPGWEAVLGQHRAIVREIAQVAGGVEMGTGGDSFFLTFDSAVRGVEAAVRVQRALMSHAWPPDAEVRVRIGLHTGEATAVGDDLVGVEIHRAARIADAAHGGQIVVSATTWSIVSGGLPEIEFRDLGEHRLKDLARPERVLQVIAAGLPSDFPPLRTLDAIPNNLPTQLTSFVGRRALVDEARRLLAGTRALTLTGPGGTGKTRLSLQLAADVLPDFSGGAYFVALAPINDPSLVAPTIAKTLGLQQSSDAPIVDTLIDHLRDKSTLLVLDNFEQVLPAAPVLTSLLRASPGLKVIVTSRSVLHISGEQELHVPSLGLPPADRRGRMTAESLTQYEAVALFIERAIAVKPDFRVTNENAPAIAAICVRLDGLPLAIELAAARIKLLPPAAMLARLEHSLGVLISKAADLPDRQRTLRDTIAWSHDLLDADERRLFAQFGVFVGGARLEEAERVCEIGTDGREAEALDGLARLVDQSLLRQTEETDEPRFAMLETIREFALEQLEASGEQETVRERHARAYLELAERAEPELMGADQRMWLDRLEREHGNLRAAIEWAVSRDEAEVALRVASALWRFWQMRGYLTEARERLATVLAMHDVERHADFLAKAHEAAGGVAYWQGNLPSALEHYEGSLAIHRDMGDERAVANDLYNLVFTRVIALFERAGTEEGRRDAEWARGILAESREIYERLGDEHGLAKVQWGLGAVEGALDPEAGREAYTESLRLYRKVGDVFGIGWSLRELGTIEERLVHLAEAQRYLREALSVFVDAQDVSGITLLLNDLSRIELARGRLQCGARLGGAAAALQSSSGTDLATIINQALGQANVADVDEATLRAEWEIGQGLSIEEAVALALEDPEPDPAPMRRARYPG
ncbi:MAG: hypothetical protein K5924_03000 [Chloroflexi bacterium]|nr:hypothetical protein [Chloroflexota bacterium]